MCLHSGVEKRKGRMGEGDFEYVMWIAFRCVLIVALEFMLGMLVGLCVIYSVSAAIRYGLDRHISSRNDSFHSLDIDLCDERSIFQSDMYSHTTGAQPCDGRDHRVSFVV